MILFSKNDVVEKLTHERHLQMSHAGVVTKCARCKIHAVKGFESIPTPLLKDRDTLEYLD